jgi:hypothetical protein
MALLWVIAVNLFARFADLLDNDEVGMAFDDLLDPRLFVAWDQHEVVALTRDPFVLGGKKVDGLETGAPPAFAMDAKPGRDTVPLRDLLDSFVDPSEDLLVPRRPVSELHAGSIPDGARLYTGTSVSDRRVLHAARVSAGLFHHQATRVASRADRVWLVAYPLAARQRVTIQDRLGYR